MSPTAVQEPVVVPGGGVRGSVPGGVVRGAGTGGAELHAGAGVSDALGAAGAAAVPAVASRLPGEAARPGVGEHLVEVQLDAQ